jgi:hypothetical protein
MRNADMPRGREFRMKASGRRAIMVGEDRSTTREPNGAPGLSLARSNPRSPMLARLTKKCSTVHRYSSSTCRARSVAQRRSDFARCSARPAPNSSRAFVTAANCTTSGRPAVCSPAMQTPLAPIAAPPWTRQRLAKLDEPRRHIGSSRVSGLHRFADSSRSRLSSRPRSLPSATQSSANRLRPCADFETGGRRRRRRIRKRPCGWVDRHAKTSATCVASRRYQRDASSTELRSICSSRQRLLATSPPQEGQFFVLRHRHAIRGSTISRCASP